MDRNKIAVDTYNKIAKTYTRHYFGDLSDTPYIDKFLGYLQESANILDVGCGPGQFTKYLINKGFRVVGIDLSNEMIKIAKKMVPEAKFRKMDMRKLHYKNNSFDGLLVAYSLIHIRNKEVLKTLKEFHRVLKPKGYIIIIVQKGESDKIIKEPLKTSLKMFINFFTIERLSNLLTKANFKIIYKKQVKNVSDPNSLSDELVYIIARKE